MRRVLRLVTTAVAAVCAITTGVRTAHADTTAQSSYNVTCPGFSSDSVTQAPGPAEANWPVTSGPNLGMTDFGPDLTGVHVDATTLQMASYQELTDAGSSAQTRCDLNGGLTNTLTVGAGTSGLAAGDPVTVVATMSLDGTLGYFAKSGSFTADSNATVKFRVTDPANFGQQVLSYVADGYSITDGSAGDPVTGQGGFVTEAYKHDLYLSSNAAASIVETPAEVDDRPSAVWPNGSGLANSPISFATDIGTRSMAFTTTVGATLDLEGSIATTEFTSGGVVASTADLDPGFAAFFAADPANHGITLTLGTGGASAAPTGTYTSYPKSSYVYGEPVSLSVGVGSNAGIVTGPVVVSDGTAQLATINLHGTGQATFQWPAVAGDIPLSVGTHQLTFAYAGNSDYAPSAAVATVSVVKDSTTTQLLATMLKPHDEARLSATITTVAPGIGTPTGTVTFTDGTKVLGTAPVSSGSAALLVNRKLVTGRHALSATYNGDSTHLASSGPLTKP